MINKKGVSVMIGYVLLVSLAVVMGIALYSWMKSYVPQDEVQCPDDVSVVIKEYHYNCSTQELNITLLNAGKFNVSGYIPRGAMDSNQEIPTIGLANYTNRSPMIYRYEDAIMWDDGDEATLQNNNIFNPGKTTFHLYELSLGGNLGKIQITPVRWQETKNKLLFVSCGDSSYTETLSCST